MSWLFDEPAPEVDPDFTVGRWVQDFGPYRVGDVCVFTRSELRAMTSPGYVIQVGGPDEAAHLLRRQPFTRFRG